MTTSDNTEAALESMERMRVRLSKLEAFAAAFAVNRLDDRNVTWVAVLEAWREVEKTDR